MIVFDGANSGSPIVLPAAERTLGGGAPNRLTGTSSMQQALFVTGAAQNGMFASSEGHELAIDRTVTPRESASARVARALHQIGT